MSFRLLGLALHTYSPPICSLFHSLSLSLQWHEIDNCREIEQKQSSLSLFVYTHTHTLISVFVFVYITIHLSIILGSISSDNIQRRMHLNISLFAFRKTFVACGCQQMPPSPPHINHTDSTYYIEVDYISHICYAVKSCDFCSAALVLNHEICFG